VGRRRPGVRPQSPEKRRTRVVHVERTYGVPERALEALERHQWLEAGRPVEEWEPGWTVCWGCRRATGAAKALAMDHNHRTGEARMLLCATCNHDVLGHFRDNPAGLVRLGLALISPPSREAWTALGLPPPGFWSHDAGLVDWVEFQLGGGAGDDLI
jgi:hypothetical protein